MTLGKVISQTPTADEEVVSLYQITGTENVNGLGYSDQSDIKLDVYFGPNNAEGLASNAFKINTYNGDQINLYLNGTYTQNGTTVVLSPTPSAITAIVNQIKQDVLAEPLGVVSIQINSTQDQYHATIVEGVSLTISGSLNINVTVTDDEGDVQSGTAVSTVNATGAAL